MDADLTALHPVPPSSVLHGPQPPAAGTAKDPARWLVLGDPSALERPSVAVVGTRNPRHLAFRVAPAAVEAAGRLGVPVAAGLAAGTDALVREAAADRGVGLVAWSPAHPSRLPEAYLEAVRAVVGRPGCCVVVPADPAVSPGLAAVQSRNAALAAGCAVMVVAEARPRSLSLHAAACAVEASRALVVPNVAAHHRGATAAGVKMLGLAMGTTVRALGWPAHLERYLDRHAPAANAVCDSPARLTDAVVLAHRLAAVAS